MYIYIYIFMYIKAYKVNTYICIYIYINMNRFNQKYIVSKCKVTKIQLKKQKGNQGNKTSSK